MTAKRQPRRECLATTPRSELSMRLKGNYSNMATLKELFPVKKSYAVDLDRVPESVSMIIDEIKHKLMVKSTTPVDQLSPQFDSPTRKACWWCIYIALLLVLAAVIYSTFKGFLGRPSEESVFSNFILPDLNNPYAL